MAQVARRQAHYRSPPARKIPALPNPIRIEQPKHYRMKLATSDQSEQSLSSFTSSNQNHNIKESFNLSQLNEDDDDELLRKKHLPVYARFPFNSTFLTQPMETNIEDNIHKLRLRLIDSELNHQRRSSDEYIKRTHRIAMENNLSIEQAFDPRQCQDSINQHRRLNNVYEPRLPEQQIYTSSNMDDLIDSMARRHLAYRRLDAAIDRQRRTNGYHPGPYTEVLGTGRRSVRNDDYIAANRLARNYSEREFHHLLRSRMDYYNRLQPDVDSLVNEPSTQRLPPISSRTRKSEELIDLPSDIYLSSRSKIDNSTQTIRKTRPRSLSKENQLSIENEQRKAIISNNSDGFFTESSNSQNKKTKVIRNKFKKVSIGTLFFISLKRQAIRNRSNHSIRSTSATIHKIRLQEIVVALHRVYLEPDGPIFNALIQAISHSVSLEHALNRSSKHYPEAIKIIGIALKNIFSKILDFMPKDGVLGTGKTSAISTLLENGNTFPEKYFWSCERDLLEFDHLKVININKQRAILLLIGVFIFRALVTTLLIKPIKYRLILGQLTAKQAISLKVLASVILYIGRRAAGMNSRSLPLPNEWQLSLCSDADIQSIIQHTEIQSIIDLCEHSLRMWCEEYIRRVDQSFNRRLRS